MMVYLISKLLWRSVVLSSKMNLAWLYFLTFMSLIIAAERDLPEPKKSEFSASESEEIKNPMLPKLQSSGASKKMEPSLSWSISRAIWGLGSPGQGSNHEKKNEGVVKKGKFEMSNRHHRFNRPPLGKVLTGVENVNHPGLYSSSAKKPTYMGCSGTPCTLPPNNFRAPDAKWAQNIWNVKTPRLPYYWTPLPPLTLPYRTVDVRIHG